MRAEDIASRRIEVYHRALDDRHTTKKKKAPTKKRPKKNSPSNN